MTTIMNWFEPTFTWLLRVSAQAAVLIVLILLLQSLFRDRLAPRWRYALWLLLPESTLAAFSAEELRYVFLHELAHVKRRDMLVNWFVTILQVAHWFNPLVWVAFRRMAAERELAADALALSRLESRENVAYGSAIIKLLKNLLSPAPLPGLVGILEDKNHMKRRINMIAKFKKTNRWPVLAILAFASLALIALTDAQTTPGARKAATNAAGDQNRSVARAATERTAGRLGHGLQRQSHH